MNDLKPEVNMPATVAIGSDQYAAKIVKVLPSLKTVFVKEEGSSEIEKYTLRKYGHYIKSGSKCIHLRLGYAKTKIDEGF